MWNDANTIRSTTVGWNHNDYVGAEMDEQGGTFIGVSFEGLLIIRGKIKIRFNIGG